MDNVNINSDLLEDFINKFSSYILSKNTEELFSCFSEDEKNKETVKKSKKLFANSEIMSKIVNLSLEKEKVQDNFVTYSGKIKEKSGFEYPFKIRIEKEDEGWKIVDVELIPLPYDCVQ
jgi:hypothetical protein